MSVDEIAADDGALPAATAETEQQVTPQEPAAAEGENEAKEQERARDEKGRFQSRVNELTRNWRQTERERDALYAQLQQYQSQQQQPQAQGNEPPSIEEFSNVNEWANAVAKHAREQAVAEARKEFSERQQYTQQEQVFQSYAVKAQEYAASNPGYADAYSALQSSVRFPQTSLEVIADSSHGPAMVEYLGTHLDVADQISRLPPHRAAAELARIEAKVSTPKTKPVTKAPDPAPTLGGGATASKDPDAMSTDEWVRWRNKQLKQR